MERVNDTGNIMANRVILVSPDKLRLIADRMEALGRETIPGESVICSFSPTTTFVYECPKRVNPAEVG